MDVDVEILVFLHRGVDFGVIVMVLQIRVFCEGVARPASIHLLDGDLLQQRSVAPSHILQFPH